MQKPELKPRMLSLDVARGFTIMFMILVNNPGDWNYVYSPLEHSKWNGFTPTDFVFPSFIFIVGISIVFALISKKEKQESHAHIIFSIIKRGIILFFIGLFITAFVMDFDFANTRIPGVLQRIAVVYVISSLLFIKLSTKTITYIAFSLLVFYYLLLNFVPVPGYGPANLNPATNLGAWLDRLVFSPPHLYRFTKTWDPEGILSTVSSIATGLFGVLTGIVLKRNSTTAVKLKQLLGFGCVFVAAGLLANFIFPINKNLWTSSYVLFTAGLSMLMLGLFYWLIDIKGYKSWTKIFVVFGVNSIFAYMCSELFPTILGKIPIGNTNVLSYIYYNAYQPMFTSHYNSSLAFAISLVLFFFPFLWYMQKHNILVKV